MKLPGPSTLLSARELAKELGGVAEDEVLRLKKDRKLFEVTRVSVGKKQTGYPIFQAWAGIAGKPLETVLAAIGSHSADVSSEAYAFFIGVNEFLGGLTPIEVLQGTLLTTRQLPPPVERLLDAPTAERLDEVVQAAHTTLSSRAG
jgi:hypothetical protein